jgi:hypothetical protein
MHAKQALSYCATLPALCPYFLNGIFSLNFEFEDNFQLREKYQV